MGWDGSGPTLAVLDGAGRLSGDVAVQHHQLQGSSPKDWSCWEGVELLGRRDVNPGNPCSWC